MSLGGLWHGASFVFVLWGLWHGVLLVLERMTGFDIFSEKIPTFTRIYTFVMVVIGWILFHSTSLNQAVEIFKGLTGSRGFVSAFNPVFLRSYLFSAPLCFAGLVFFVFFEPGLFRDGGLLQRAFGSGEKHVIFATLVLALIVRFSEEGVPFLYFQF